MHFHYIFMHFMHFFSEATTGRYICVYVFWGNLARGPWIRNLLLHYRMNYNLIWLQWTHLYVIRSLYMLKLVVTQVTNNCLPSLYKSVPLKALIVSIVPIEGMIQHVITYESENA